MTSAECSETVDPSGRAVRATFVMETHLGHESFYRNLRGGLDGGDRVDATWIEVDYHRPGSRWWWPPQLAAPRAGSLAGRRQVVLGLRSSAPEVALFNTQVPAMLGGLATRRRPYVLCTDITPRQYDRMADQYGHLTDRLPPVRAAKHALNRWLLGGAERVLPWSTWARDSLIDEYGVDPGRIEVIAPGIDLSVWTPSACDRRHGPVRILFVGGDLERKGGVPLIEAFCRLEPGLAELHIVTRTPEVPPGEGIVVHRGMVPNARELVALFRSSDVFALPSKGEAFGIAAAEASACGLPIVGAPTGGLRDIAVDGQTGLVVDPDDTAALTATLRRLVEDVTLRRRLGAGARKRAERHFDAGRNATRVAEILIEAAERRGAARPRDRSHSAARR